MSDRALVNWRFGSEFVDPVWFPFSRMLSPTASEYRHFYDTEWFGNKSIDRIDWMAVLENCRVIPFNCFVFTVLLWNFRARKGSSRQLRQLIFAPDQRRTWLYNSWILLWLLFSFQINVFYSCGSLLSSSPKHEGNSNALRAFLNCRILPCTAGRFSRYDWDSRRLDLSRWSSWGENSRKTWDKSSRSRTTWKFHHRHLADKASHGRRFRYQ